MKPAIFLSLATSFYVFYFWPNPWMELILGLSFGAYAGWCSAMHFAGKVIKEKFRKGG